MKKLKNYWLAGLIFIFCIIFAYNPGLADDTCIFITTADDIPPNIVLLLDNGAEMEHIAWHSAYVNTIDYTPGGAVDVVPNGATGTGFYNDRGYGIVGHGSSYYLVKVLANLELDAYGNGLNLTSSCTLSLNSKTITLPGEPSTVVDGDGVKDNAVQFRYSKNYLNWLFFTSEYVDASSVDDGSDLPDKTRFYYAKKAMFTVAKLASNQANFGIYNFTSTSAGASNVQPLGLVVDTVDPADPENNVLDSNFVNNVNNMGSVTFSPLAEGLATIGAYYNSPSSGVVSEYCQKNFVIVITPGLSSEDLDAVGPQYTPCDSDCAMTWVGLADYDGDDAGGAIGEGNIKADATTYAIPIRQNGSTYLDDVAYYMYMDDDVGYQTGFQNVFTYTIGFMGNLEGNLFLINTSNNGNGNLNLYDTTDPKYAKYHYEAEDPDALASELLAALNDILSRTNSFTAPVVPVTRSMSGNRNYMAFFKPSEENFWEGNVTKFGIGPDNEIVDKFGNIATWPNGAIKDEAVPYWATKDWADNMDNATRNIYTYMGASASLTAASNEFSTSNAGLTSTVLGNPDHLVSEVINYIRGADAFDEDTDGNHTENREIITGDVLHSEPLVVDHGTYKVVYFGANDGMLHAVYDTELEAHPNNGKEMWGFIPPDQLPRLKDIIEGVEHQFSVDSSPQIFESDSQKILVCGERKGGTTYFALDVTDPFEPIWLWSIDHNDIPGLGQTWSEPRFGLVKTSDEDTTGTDVFFIGGGYSEDNTAGKMVLAINVLDGTLVKQWDSLTDMDYSFASSVSIIDEDSNGFADKIYIGDLGSQVWRFGKFTDSEGDPLDFPECDENINSWEGHIFFLADAAHEKKFYYPPSVTFEEEFDAVFTGTGDRENACSEGEYNKIYCMRDFHHTDVTWDQDDLVNITDPADTPPDLGIDDDVDGNLEIDQGWYFELDPGEKVLAKGTVFYKVYYITTFTPNDDVCVPGGVAKLYAFSYLTGEVVPELGLDEDNGRSTEIGGGIPSRTVLIITETGEKLLVSVGSTTADGESGSFGAGIRTFNPVAPPINFFYLWWKELPLPPTS